MTSRNTTFLRELTLRHWLFCVLCISWLGSTWSMTLTPIEAQLTPTGRGTSTVFRLSNTGPDPIAVDLSVKKRTMSRSGQDVLSDADADFTVVPSQISLQPGQVQSVRVQYVGEPVTGTEQAYRFIAEQLPLDSVSEAKAASTPNAGVRLLIKYIASVYVSPPRAKPQVQLVHANLLPKSEHAPARMEVVLKNTGQAHTLLKNSQLQFVHAGKPYAFGPEQLAGLDKENLLADTERVFTVLWPQAPTLTSPVAAQDARFKQE